MLSRPFVTDGAENEIYVGLIRKTMGDIDSGKNCPAAQLEKAAVVDPSLIWPGAAPGDHGGRCLPGGYNYRQFRICIWGPRTVGFPRSRGAGRSLRYSIDSLAAFGRSGSVRSYDLDRTAARCSARVLGVGLTHVAHLVKWCRRRLCTPPSANFPYSTLSSPQAESVASNGSRDVL